MQQQQKKPSWLQQIFCGCVREEPIQQDSKIQRLSSQMEIQKTKPITLISMQQQEGWLNKGTSQEVDYTKEIEEVDSDDENKVYNRQLSYLQKDAQLQKTSFSDEFNSNNIEQRLLHRCGGLLARRSSVQIETQSNQWIMRIFKDVQLVIQDKEFEQKFKQQLVNPSITDVINKRIKQNSVLLAHDPTGSILLRLASPSRKIYYLESDKTFNTIIDRGICKTKVKVEKVLKMDLEQKLDIVVVNLLFIDSVYNLQNIMHEYLQYAHDIIILLQPNIENQMIFSAVENAISFSDQAKQSCSIELQHLVENEIIIGKIVYFGDVTEINLNDELNFVYSCLDSTTRKQYNYKLMFRDIRNQFGMSKLIKMLHDYQIISGNGSFVEFANANGWSEKYRIIPQITKEFETEQKNANLNSGDQSASSSTESEPEEESQDRLENRSETLNKSQSSLKPPRLRHANSQPFNM